MEDYALNWQIVLVIVFLIGALATIIKPIIDLNVTIRTLDLTLENMQKDLCKSGTENEKEHEEFAERLDEHGNILNEHDKSIHELRNKFK
jgi:hypothetical protein